MVQPIDTADYGKLMFTRFFIGTSLRVDNVPVAKGGSVGILTNGTWVHFPSGHPIKSREEAVRILSETNPDFVREFEDWWEHRDELAEMDAEVPVRDLMICPDDTLRYRDTNEEVLMVTDIYEYFTPNSMGLELALRIFTVSQQRREKEEARRLLSKDGNYQTNLDEAFGRQRTGRAAPVTAEEAKKNARDEQRAAALEKAREARRKKLDEKKRKEAQLAEQKAEAEKQQEESINA